jgi:hypothetical protein
VEDAHRADPPEDARQAVDVQQSLLDEFDAGIQPCATACAEVVDDNRIAAGVQEGPDDVRTDIPGTTGDQPKALQSCWQSIGDAASAIGLSRPAESHIRKSIGY